VHGGLLADPANPAHRADMTAHGIEPIDLVVVNLYPFESNPSIELIDIGGPAMVRAGAKNHAHVGVVVNPSDYDVVLAEIQRDGALSAGTRRRLARDAFAAIAAYDAAIANWFETSSTDPLPAAMHLSLERVQSLRYGENPHQRAAVYAAAGGASALAAHREVKELSYNNLLDLEAAVSLVGRYERPACIIVKHNQPCGAACADTLVEAYRAALASDPLSAFGGIVAFNRTLDAATASELATLFVECVAFPAIAPEADAALAGRKNLRLVQLSPADLAVPGQWALRAVGPWTLAQRDEAGEVPAWRTVTKRAPTDAEFAALRFAWPVVDAARSNAIVLARGEASIGLGSGQTSRVDAVDVALMKARRAGHDPRGAVLASDGFFPFPDGVTHAAEAGITAIVQPGGSVKDAEVIAEADRLGVAMLFTDRRVFRH